MAKPSDKAPKPKVAAKESAQSGANLGFEAKLWLTADKLRNNMDAAEYKHVVLGLIFLKYISDTFDEHHAKLVAGKGDYAGANPEDKDEYKAENVFWVPKEARWARLQASAKQPTVGKVVDDAMVAIGKLGDISIYGQESNATTRRLAVMNLALRGIEADFGPEHADTFRRDLHPDLRADYVLANPPFNDSDWFRKDDDVRWQYGIPPKGNANFAWVSHFIHCRKICSPSAGVSFQGQASREVGHESKRPEYSPRPAQRGEADARNAAGEGQIASVELVLAVQVDDVDFLQLSESRENAP